MTTILAEEMQLFPSLASFTATIVTKTVVLIITVPVVNGTNGSTTETTTMTMGKTTDMYRPGTNESNSNMSTTTESTSMTIMTTSTIMTTMMMSPVARLEGCIGLSVSNATHFSHSLDAMEAAKKMLARAAGVMDSYVQIVSLVPGDGCSGRRLDTVSRRLQALQEAVTINYIIEFPGHLGTEAAIQAAESSKMSLETIAVEQMTTILAEEMLFFPSLASLTATVVTKSVVLIITVPVVNGTNGSTTETTTMTMGKTTDMYKPGMNESNMSTTTASTSMTMMTTTYMHPSNGSSTTGMIMTTTDMVKPGMNVSNGSISTTETTSMTMMTTTLRNDTANQSTMVTTTSIMTTTTTAPVVHLEGCIGLSVSNASHFSNSPDAIEAMRKVLARVAGVMDSSVQIVSINLGVCGGRRLNPNPPLQEGVTMNYIIEFSTSLGSEAAIQAAESSKMSLETIAVEQVTAILGFQHMDPLNHLPHQHVDLRDKHQCDVYQSHIYKHDLKYHNFQYHHSDINVQYEKLYHFCMKLKTTTTATVMPGTCPQPFLPGSFDVSECIYQNPGQSCYVRCATAFGWFGEPALYVCLQNENYEGTPPICVTTTSTTTTSITRTTTTKTDLIVCGGGLPLGVGIDASDCSGQVTSGDICTVRCSPGFDGMAQDYVCNPFTTMFHGEAMNCTRLILNRDSSSWSVFAESEMLRGGFAPVGDFGFDVEGHPFSDSDGVIEDGKPRSSHTVKTSSWENTGYEPADSSFECRSDRLFYGNPPTCSRLPCDVATLPVALGLDTSNCQNLFVGNQCEVSCSAGYQAASNSVNPATLQCHLNTSFTGTAPLCQPKECLVPSTWAQDPTFNTTCAGTTHGETCVAQCSQGYTGPSTQFLCDNGNLAGTPPTCTGIVCAFQGFELSVGLLASDCYQKTTGETCQMQCIRGYDLTGDASSTCQADGSFTSISSACHPKTCSSLQSVTPFSTIDVVDTCGQNSTFGEVCMSFCDTGFDMSGNATVLVCDEAPATSAGYIEYVPETAQTFPAEQSSGPTCAARNCTVGIPNVLGGTSDCAGKVTYETCTVEASLGYTLQAGESNTLLCQAGGAFNQTAPTILPGTCADPSFDAGVGSSCQSQQIGSHCWAYCLSGWSGVSQRYNCEANVTANALLLQPDTTGIQCTWTGRRLSRRLQAGCDSTSVSAAGLADAQYYQDCDGKANNEVCIAHCSFGWTMTEAAPSIYTCSSGSLTGASLPTCTPAPCTFDFPSGLGILHDCDGVRTQQTCTATCTATGYTYATGASAEVYTCQAAGNVQGTLPQCQRTACTDLSLAATYVHDCVGKLYQDSCGVSCAAGFRGAGAQFSCQGDGSFAGTLPACVGNPCSNDLPNSSIWTATCDGLTTGQSCDVSCNPGFSGASTNLTCDASGQLLGTVPVCAPQLCPSSIQLVSVEHTHTCQDIAFGSSCTVFCAAGYALDTGSTIQDWSCGLVGGSLQLQGTLPSCVPVPCVSGLPANTSQVVSDCEGLRTGEQCHQHCAVGYENTTEETNFVCQSNGLATGSQTSCQPIACEGMSVNLSRVQHTCQSGSVFPRSCYASCIQGYSAPVEQWFCGDESMGPALGFEVYKGVTLRGSMPNCTASPCEFNLPVGSLYSHNCSGVVTGEDCLVSCADGWEGMPEVLTCGADAALAGSFPLCTAITSTVSTSVSTVTSTMTRTFTDAQAATTTSVTSTVLNQTCPQELPDVPGAGVFNCTGWTVAQECRADCESQNGTEAVIVCKCPQKAELRSTILGQQHQKLATIRWTHLDTD
ncbi:EGF and pentraxin domain-containing protein 1 (CCP module-containing protein 22) (Polydom) (Selectin-like osteoblast-derived protein) (SEL-OB) (Serologically defined breast cancer antigen NY-BR-38) [Durusdinium trenchii]|uniref:EGF and pentraxin domain-containing protein 1 (CCP module-containing protein 22) (Polydom) (Selectin-like osteoblast-derived protein) (SEL-OB) (Serologically defined breast cancer antigen NY-BR-38) n=1 Tax=Durusdinium trenchii TaxID=1381693 RepID=A0ABP0JLW2_9DINO